MMVRETNTVNNKALTINSLKHTPKAKKFMRSPVHFIPIKHKITRLSSQQLLKDLPLPCWLAHLL
jgi:hypothetical protein